MIATGPGFWLQLALLQTETEPLLQLPMHLLQIPLPTLCELRICPEQVLTIGKAKAVLLHEIKECSELAVHILKPCFLEKQGENIIKGSKRLCVDFGNNGFFVLEMVGEISDTNARSISDLLQSNLADPLLPKEGLSRLDYPIFSGG